MINCLLDFYLSYLSDRGYRKRHKHFSFVAEILVMLEVTYSLSNSPIKQLHAASPLQAQYE